MRSAHSRRSVVSRRSAVVAPSPRKGKKWRATLDDGAVVDFGARGYEDYTMHRDAARKEAYLRRHRAREDWTDPRTAGFWSRWLLWGEPSLVRAARRVPGVAVTLRT